MATLLFLNDRYYFDNLLKEKKNKHKKTKELTNDCRIIYFCCCLWFFVVYRSSPTHNLFNLLATCRRYNIVLIWWCWWRWWWCWRCSSSSSLSPSSMVLVSYTYCWWFLLLLSFVGIASVVCILIVVFIVDVGRCCQCHNNSCLSFIPFVPSLKCLFVWILFECLTLGGTEYEFYS